MHRCTPKGRDGSRSDRLPRPALSLRISPNRSTCDLVAFESPRFQPIGRHQVGSDPAESHNGTNQMITVGPFGYTHAVIDRRAGSPGDPTYLGHGDRHLRARRCRFGGSGGRPSFLPAAYFRDLDLHGEFVDLAPGDPKSLDFRDNGPLAFEAFFAGVEKFVPPGGQPMGLLPSRLTPFRVSLPRSTRSTTSSSLPAGTGRSAGNQPIRVVRPNESHLGSSRSVSNFPGWAPTATLQKPAPI